MKALGTADSCRLRGGITRATAADCSQENEGVVRNYVSSRLSDPA